MDANDLIKAPQNTLRGGGRPHMGLGQKGSDVNLEVHLVRDAFMGASDEAAILTNGTDLIEAVRIVTREVGLPVTLLTPENRPAGGLVKVASHVRHSGLSGDVPVPANSDAGEWAHNSEDTKLVIGNGPESSNG